MGGGEMGKRIREFDWTASPLGPIDTWDRGLRIALDICLGSRFPSHIWWGPDLINLYNDAYIPVLGRRHPGSLGRPAQAIWTEIWPQLLPEVEAVMARGESSWNERRHVVLQRNGFSEEAWFTWTFSPLRDDAGRVGGLNCITIEDTQRVLEEKSRERLSGERQRKEADERARSILESIGDAFFSLDAEWRFTYLNPQTLVLLGRPPADLVGKVLWDEYPGLHGSPFEPVYRDTAARRQPHSIVAYFPDHQRWYDVRAYPASDGISVYFRDVSAVKTAESERERIFELEKIARHAAEQAGKIKDEFLATLSHELRTPLNAVLGWCEVLMTSPLTDPSDIRSGLKTIERNALAQAQIISDILDMSGFLAGKVRLHLQPANLESVIREAIETVRPAAEAKHISLTLVVGPASSQISGDPARLQQVFWNLLSNAVKFTPKGGRIEVELRRVDSHFEVSISDTGIGIDRDFLPYVFDRFRQADSSSTRQFGGLGLGLSLVKQLVELHGGTVRAESAGPGHGTKVTAAVPVAALRPETPPAQERRAPGFRDGIDAGLATNGGIAGIRILVVDDEPDARALVKRLLEDRGALVTTAASAAEALALIMAQAPDVLVSDIGMPGEDGHSLILRVRSLRADQGGKIPALALTAYARSDDRTRSILAGFQMHLSKPVSPSELIAMVQRLSGRLG